MVVRVHMYACTHAERSPQTEPNTRVPLSCLGSSAGGSIRHVRAHSLDAGVGVVGWEGISGCTCGAWCEHVRVGLTASVQQLQA